MNTTRQHLSSLRRWWRHALAGIGSLVFFLALLFALTPKSNGIRLDSFGGKSTFATAISDRGEIFGCYMSDDGEARSIIWDAHGKIHPSEQNFRFPTYNTSPPPPEDSDEVFAVSCFGPSSISVETNNHGSVGSRKVLGGILLPETSSGWSLDPAPSVEDLFRYSNDLNDSGQVVGKTFPYGRHSIHQAAFFDDAFGAINLGTLGGSSSEAFAISEAGQVAGQAQTNDEKSHAFLWEIPPTLYLKKSHAVKWDVPLLRDLGTLGGEESSALGLNNLGQIVGSSETATGQTHAFLWDDENGMQDIHHLLQGDTSIAADINDHGQIVGYAGSNSGKIRAFCWSPHSGLTWLDDFGAETSIAVRINNHGQIVGLIQFPPPWPIRSWNWLAGKIPALHAHQIYDSKHTRADPVLWTIPPPVTNTPRAASEN